MLVGHCETLSLQDTHETVWGTFLNETQLQDTFVGYSHGTLAGNPCKALCVTILSRLLSDILVRDFYKTLLFDTCGTLWNDTFVRQFYLSGTLVRHSCVTFLQGALVGHFCMTLFRVQPEAANAECLHRGLRLLSHPANPASWHSAEASWETSYELPWHFDVFMFVMFVFLFSTQMIPKEIADPRNSHMLLNRHDRYLFKTIRSCAMQLSALRKKDVLFRWRQKGSSI